MKKNEQEYLINKKYEYAPDVESHASIISRLFFFWTFNLIKKGSQKHLELNDLFEIKDNEEPGYSHGIFSQIFNQSKISNKKILTSMKNFIGDKFVLAGILAALSHSLLLIGPVMIKHMLIFI